MPNELTTIPFNGATLLAIKGDTPEATLVAMKPIVEGMGLQWSGQLQRIKRHPVLATCVCIMAMQPPESATQPSDFEDLRVHDTHAGARNAHLNRRHTHAGRGFTQSREMVFLPLPRVNFFLATVDPARIKDRAIRDAVIAYQIECADVLFRHFFAQAAGAQTVAEGITISIPEVDQLPFLTLKERNKARYQQGLIVGAVAVLNDILKQARLRPVAASPATPAQREPIQTEEERQAAARRFRADRSNW